MPRTLQNNRSIFICPCARSPISLDTRSFYSGSASGKRRAPQQSVPSLKWDSTVARGTSKQTRVQPEGAMNAGDSYLMGGYCGLTCTVTAVIAWARGRLLFFLAWFHGSCDLVLRMIVGVGAVFCGRPKRDKMRNDWWWEGGRRLADNLPSLSGEHDKESPNKCG